MEQELDKVGLMNEAFAEANKALQQNEVPIGCVIADPTGKIIGRGYNRRELDQNALAHAEILAITEACRNLGSWRLLDCSLFVTLEPCAMCAGAIINSRIKNVYYAALDPKAGACGSVVDLLSVEKFNHHPHVIRGLLRDKAADQLKTFFRDIRAKQKKAKAELQASQES